MAVRSALRTLILDDFSGGLNLRDAPSQVADNESPDCMNVTLDERGGVVKRLGLERLGSGTAIAAAPSNLFYSKALDSFFVQDGTALKKTTDFVSFTTVKTYTTSATAGFCEFNGLLVAVHEADGVATYNGTTWTDIVGSPDGKACAAWQGRVLVVGDPANPTRLYACKAGDVTIWTTGAGEGWTNDIREKDDSALVALGLGQGMDIAGRPGLLVFKNHSVYRVHDSSNGAYTTLDLEAGAAGPRAIATVLGKTVFVGPDGIFETNGIDPPVRVSAKVEPLFRPTQLNYAQMAKWCAGVYRQDRIVFSLTYGTAQTTNNRTLEYHADQGWITPHSFGCSAFTSYQKDTNKLYGASPTAGKCFEVFKSGADDGAAITARFQTRWFEPGNGYQTRLRRLRVEGRGAFSVYTKGDYTQGAGVLSQFANVSGGGMTWGSGVWGTGLWGADSYENYQDFFSLGVAKAVSWNLTETSSSSALAPKLLQDGVAAEVGAFACYGLTLDFVRLGFS